MSRYYYDLHIHSALSPCADDDNTPANIIGMAKLVGLDIIALTDHNSTRNCPAFFELARENGIIPIAGMELTTSEDVHMVCLFEDLAGALEFGAIVEDRLLKIKNRPDIFGKQLVVDREDKIECEIENLLAVASDISLDDLPSILKNYRGICYPAHIDRPANGIIAVLGDMPKGCEFKTVEFNDTSNIAEYTEKYGLSGKNIIINSDSHYLGTINDKEHFIELSAKRENENDIRKELIGLLG